MISNRERDSLQAVFSEKGIGAEGSFTAEKLAWADRLRVVRLSQEFAGCCLYSIQGWTFFVHKICAE